MSAKQKQNKETEENTAQSDAIQAETEQNDMANNEEVLADENADNDVEALNPIQKLEQKLQQAEAKATENWDSYLRAKAEMDNLRRRNVKDVENAHKYGIEKLASELLPIMDSMTAGLAIEDADSKSLREGMVLTMNILKKMMENLNIEEVDPLNEKFDAEKHQAMAMQPSEEVEPNTVIAVMQKGYLLNNRLLRPAMVMVSKAAETQ